jgi:hypothetical protein
VLSTAEWLCQLELFDVDGLLSWRILSLRAEWLSRSRLLEHLCGRRGMAVILAARLACGAAVTLPVAHGLRAALLTFIVVTGWLFKQRRWLSDDGSDQMGQIVAMGAAMTAMGLAVQDLLLAYAGVLLIAGQLTIAFFASGATKLLSYEWRSGRAAVGIMGTHSFGHELAARIASSSAGFAVACCWLVIALEIAFPMALIGSNSALIALLVTGALFHVATAVFMGLNTYFWSFLAAYPSVWMFNAVLTSVLKTSSRAGG